MRNENFNGEIFEIYFMFLKDVVFLKIIIW